MKSRLLLAAAALCIASGTGAQKIYSVDHEYQADVKVFVVDAEYRADLIVYRTDRAYNAKDDENKGIWFFTEKPYQADKKIYFVDHEYKADIRVCFTDRPYRAGWRKKDKQPLLY